MGGMRTWGFLTDSHIYGSKAALRSKDGRMAFQAGTEDRNLERSKGSRVYCTPHQVPPSRNQWNGPDLPALGSADNGNCEAIRRRIRKLLWSRYVPIEYVQQTASG